MTNPTQQANDDSVSIPIIDYSLLTSDDPHKRSIAIHDLSKACEDWGVFLVVNHGIPENLMKEVIDGMHEFFKLPHEEKQEFSEKHWFDHIRYVTSRRENDFWRDYVKVFNVPPHCNFPDKPQGYRDIVSVYCEKNREIVRKLVGGISESLGFEESLLERELDLKSGLQVFKGNYYPACPKPELSMGTAPHSDHGLITLIIANQIGGLQVDYQGKWVDANAIPNSVIAIVSDQLEIVSNGKYKSSLHRAVLNNKVTRVSITVNHGPSFDAIVSPPSSLIQKEKTPAAYKAITYKDYLELQQCSRRTKAFGKETLKGIMIPM